jgi:hypothetical protein
VEDAPLTSQDRDERTRGQFIAQFGEPAYARRARLTQEALDAVVRHCRRRRDEWLLMVRIHLGMLRGLAGEWSVLRPLLADDEQVRVLEQLHEDLQPRLRVPVTRTTSVRKLRSTLRELAASIVYFNRRWAEFLPGVDLARVNELRDSYNRYYLVEKECALRSPRVARHGFRQLPPCTTAELAALLPALPVPRLAC